MMIKFILAAAVLMLPAMNVQADTFGSIKTGDYKNTQEGKCDLRVTFASSERKKLIIEEVDNADTHDRCGQAGNTKEFKCQTKVRSNGDIYERCRRSVRGETRVRVHCPKAVPQPPGARGMRRCKSSGGKTITYREVLMLNGNTLFVTDTEENLSSESRPSRWMGSEYYELQ